MQESMGLKAYNCIPGWQLGILKIQYGHAAAAADISFQMR